MGIKRLFFAIGVLAVLACPAWAEDMPPPLNFSGIYEFQFSGLLFGRMGVEIAQSASHYAITSDITSEGILKLFTPHSSHTTAEASGEDFTYSDIVYDTHYQTKKKHKAVKLVYKNGKIVESIVVPLESAAKRPLVPAVLRNAAHDPLSLNLALRRNIWDALKTGKSGFSLTVFDGRRLTEVDVTMAGRKVIPYGDKEKVPVIRVSVRRKLLGGVTQSELDDYDPKEPTLWMYYSDDERLVPLKFEVGFLFGKITGALVKECRTGESCLLGLKE